jgi:hypothetical protein
MQSPDQCPSGNRVPYRMQAPYQGPSGNRVPYRMQSPDQGPSGNRVLYRMQSPDQGPKWNRVPYRTQSLIPECISIIFMLCPHYNVCCLCVQMVRYDPRPHVRKLEIPCHMAKLEPTSPRVTPLDNTPLSNVGALQVKTHTHYKCSNSVERDSSICHSKMCKYYIFNRLLIWLQSLYRDQHQGKFQSDK